MTCPTRVICTYGKEFVLDWIGIQLTWPTSRSSSFHSDSAWSCEALLSCEIVKGLKECGNSPLYKPHSGLVSYSAKKNLPCHLGFLLDRTESLAYNHHLRYRSSLLHLRPTSESMMSTLWLPRTLTHVAVWCLCEIRISWMSQSRYDTRSIMQVTPHSVYEVLTKQCFLYLYTLKWSMAARINAKQRSSQWSIYGWYESIIYLVRTECNPKCGVAKIQKKIQALNVERKELVSEIWYKLRWAW